MKHFSDSLLPTLLIVLFLVSSCTKEKICNSCTASYRATGIVKDSLLVCDRSLDEVIIMRNTFIAKYAQQQDSIKITCLP